MATKEIYSPVFQDKNLIIGTGDTVIVTGWTPVGRVAKLLDKSQYAAIGSLYSPARGLNFLVRNLLANPQYNRVVVIEATEQDKVAGGCRAFMSFFSDGVYRYRGNESYKTSSNPTGIIDSVIPESDLNALRKRLAVIEIDSVKKLTGAIAVISWQYPMVKVKPKHYPYIEPMSNTLPADIVGQKVRALTIAEGWIEVLRRIRLNGVVRPCSSGQWQELINLVTVITDEPLGFYFPEPNYLPCDRAALSAYVPQVLNDAPYLEGVKYSYGQRMRSWFKRDQIQQVIDKLAVEPDAASAVISLWDVEDHEKGGSPCLNHIWFRIVDSKLSMTALFRSNDMFSAWVLNAMALRALQFSVYKELVRSGLDIGMGELITISQSAHIYSDSWEFADRLIVEQGNKKKFASDPVGNFIITCTESGLITVTHTSLAGVAVKTYESGNPLKLVREICQHNPSIQSDHAAYLGIELQRAKTSINYVQDR